MIQQTGAVLKVFILAVYMLSAESQRSLCINLLPSYLIFSILLLYTPASTILLLQLSLQHINKFLKQSQLVKNQLKPLLLLELTLERSLLVEQLILQQRRNIIIKQAVCILIVDIIVDTNLLQILYSKKFKSSRYYLIYQY